MNEPVLYHKLINPLGGAKAVKNTSLVTQHRPIYNLETLENEKIMTEEKEAFGSRKDLPQNTAAR